MQVGKEQTDRKAVSAETRSIYWGLARAADTVSRVWLSIRTTSVGLPSTRHEAASDWAPRHRQCVVHEVAASIKNARSRNQMYGRTSKHECRPMK